MYSGMENNFLCVTYGRKVQPKQGLTVLIGTLAKMKMRK